VELAKRMSLPPGLTLDRYCSYAQPTHDFYFLHFGEQHTLRTQFSLEYGSVLLV